MCSTRWASKNFSALVEESSAPSSTARRPMRVAPRPPFDRTAHIGVHAQKQPGLNWIGVVVPVGRLSVEQMRGLAGIAADLGDGDLRLTVWQNLLISGVPSEHLASATEAHRSARSRHRCQRHPLRPRRVHRQYRLQIRRLRHQAPRRARLRDWCETRVPLDMPVNIHLTGCHHSCAQHFVSEIGLLACKVQADEEADPVEGYHILVGGGFGADAALGRELYRDVVAEEAPRTVERILKAYLARRASPDETFLAFARRHEIGDLKAMCDARGGRMSVPPRPSVPSFIPESAPFTAEQRDLAQRAVRGTVRPPGERHAAFRRRHREAAWRAVRWPRAWNRAAGIRRRRALARSRHAVAGTDEACRGPAAAAAADGRDGAAGLRAVRLQLQRLRRRTVRQIREAA